MINVIVHHGGEVEAHEEAAEVEIGDASGLNSDVEVEGEIEVETMPESDDPSHQHHHLKKLKPTLLEPPLCKSINQKLKPIYY